MKKILTLLITVIMVLSIVPVFGTAPESQAASPNTPATMVANRWNKIGYDRYGRALLNGKMVPWQKAGEEVWGRPNDGFPMPYALRAVYQRPESIPIPPATPLYCVPATGNAIISSNDLFASGLWTEVWLTVIPDGGKSTYKDHWYVILDGWGQAWFDPDGRFNDPRYYAYADPYDVNYQRDPFGSPWDNCKDNPKALVDPIVSNNTQGPYILDPDYNPFTNPNTTGVYQFHSESYKQNNRAAPEYEPRIYFWDAMNTKRLWKLGWSDINDFYALSESQYGPPVNNPDPTHFGPAGVRPTGIVYGSGGQKDYADWDVGLTLTNFTINLEPMYNMADAGSVLHAENVSHFASYPDSVVAPIPAHTPSYQYGEFIYRKGGTYVPYMGTGTGGLRVLSFVDGGDTRLTGVTIHRGSFNATYPPNSDVIDNGIPSLYEPGDDYDVGTSLWAFQDPAFDPAFTLNERFHDQVISGQINGAYNVGEFIYRDITDPQMQVSEGDIRITNVNGYQDNVNNHYPDNPTLLYDTDGLLRGGISDGDLLLMAEVLDGGCLSPEYDIAVETDAWIGWWDNGQWKGINPALTAASIRSGFDTTINHFQRVQKDAVLAEKANEFFVPATVFQKVQFEERQFGGWSIWLDDGIDNNRSYNISFAGYTKPLDLSPNIEWDETMEQMVGAESLTKWDLDYGRGSSNDLIGSLVAFTSPKIVGPRYGYYDTNGNGYGCGEHIYRDMDMETGIAGQTALSAGVLAGDTVLPVNSTTGFAIGDTISIAPDNPGEIEYRIIVAIGANTITVGVPLNFAHAAGREITEIGGFGMISRGDVRLSDVTIYRGSTMVHYYAGSIVADGDLDVGQQLTYFAPTNGMDVFFYDIPHLANGIPLNNQYDPGEDLYLLPQALTSVDFRSQRLSEIEVQGTKYHCGSMVQLGRLLWTSNPVNMISTGNNGNNAYMDFEILPGKIDVQVKVDQPFMVEQTSHVEITVNPPPTKSTDKYYVLLENLPRSAYNNIAEVFRVIDKDHDVAKFELTPYRASCDLTGFVQDRKVYVHVFKEVSDLAKYAGSLFVPQDGPYYDPYWKKVYRDPEKRAYANFARNVFDPIDDFRYHVYQPLIGHIADSYDCYGLWSSTVQPEDLLITANRQCLTVLEQRFPNLILTLTDWDNPNDVNDPAGMRFATTSIADRPHRVNYNAKGAGVKFLFTATNSDFTEKYIVQVNDDDTFICWIWYDFEPLNMLSPLDYMYFRNINTFTTALPNPRDGRNIPRRGTADKPRLPTDAEPESVLQKATVDDVDCSGRQATCDICGEEQGFLPIGAVTLNDTYGNSYINFTIQTFGVPTMVTDYGFLNTTDPGGQILCAILPRNTETKLWIRVTADQTIFNYNSVDGQLWPPNGPSFLNDYTGGADYCGVIGFKVTPPDPDVNFAEMTMVDHALQYSQCNYTVGSDVDGYHSNPLHSMGLPTPQIQIPYNPIIYDYNNEVRCYPGGQTHTGRLVGSSTLRKSGWNAYPAIHAKQFYKLGTEFFPLSDYGLFFVLKNQKGEHLSFVPVQDYYPPYDYRDDLLIKRITIEGPFMRPRFMDAQSTNFLSSNFYNGVQYLPIQYDFSGKIVIDESTYGTFEMNALNAYSGDFRNVTSPYMSNQNPVRNSMRYPQDTNIPENLYLRLLDRSLDYTAQHWANIGPSQPGGANDLFIIDEIIPINYGNIKITVELSSGKKKIYQDCCVDPPVDGINVHGLDIQGVQKEIEVDTDNVVELTLKEYLDIQVVNECNNALVFCWQDRGIKQAGSEVRYGVGDGWITNPPKNSNRQNLGWQYLPGDDINGDGKIRFNDYETEILGTYDMVTNTWATGVIDARTFQRQDGIYKFELSKANGALIDEVGFDFGGGTAIGGRFTVPDHVISDNEELPIYVTAYKYGDDDNDRSFQPYWEVPPTSQFGKAGYSHEVYLAAQTAIRVVGREDLQVTTSPDILTAGVTPEYVDGTPLTFQVYGADGSTPLDFHELGVPDWTGAYKITDDKYIANNIIQDPHPDNQTFYGYGQELPRYYWLRTDLHNNDGTQYNNNYFFSSRTNPFSPIKIDFSQSEEGKYMFRGFCANDEGSFPVHIWTPDRKHRTKIEVKVRPPKVEYQVTNVDDPDLKLFTVPANPGDVDFVLTAADNRLYKVRVICRTQDGSKLLTGAAKGVSVCAGTDKDVARFTPTFSRPMSFRNAQKYYFNLGIRPDQIPADPTPLEVTQYYETRIQPRLGFDFNGNGKLDETNNEIFIAKYSRYADRRIYSRGYGNYRYIYVYDPQEVQIGVGLPKPIMYYRTENYAYPDPNSGGLYYTLFMFCDIYADPETTTGWGPGAIYNSYKKAGYIFPDITADGIVSFADALSLDDKGSTEMYVYGEDVTTFAGLIGDNTWAATTAWGDVYGGLLPYLTGLNGSGYGFNFQTDPYAPRTMKRRYGYRPTATNIDAFLPGGDCAFYLDWDSFPANDNYLQIKAPVVEVKSATTRQTLEKKLLDPEGYDLIYGKENHLLFTFTPADQRDLPLGSEARVYLAGISGGGVHEANVYGRTERSETNPAATDVMLAMTPTGVGTGVLSINYRSPNKRFVFPYEYRIDTDLEGKSIISSFDSVKGLEVIVEADDTLKAQIPGTLNITVREYGSHAPAAQAELKIEGAGLSIPSRRCNDKGQTTVSVTPTETGIIRVKANLAGYADGEGYIVVGVDVQPPSIDQLEPIDYTVVNTNTVAVKGVTKPGSTVTINGQKVGIDIKGAFQSNVTLKEGSNVIVVKATSPSGASTTRYLTIIKDTEKPMLLVNDPTTIIHDATTYELTGRVEPGAKVTVNGQPATVVFDVWTATVNLVKGTNTVNISATDAAGNPNQTTIQLNNYTMQEVEFVVGNAVAYVNGTATTMPVAPTLSASNSVMVPVDFLANAFGGTAPVAGTTATMTIGTITVDITVGSTNVNINGQTVTLPDAPVLNGTTIMVPAEYLMLMIQNEIVKGNPAKEIPLDIQWNDAARRLTITRYSL